jgi:hypothetical protein
MAEGIGKRMNFLNLVWPRVYAFPDRLKAELQTQKLK